MSETRNNVIVERHYCLSCGKETTNAKFCCLYCMRHYIGPDGYHHSKEAREKIRIARAKQIFTKETRNAMSLRRKGKPTWNKGLTKETDPRLQYTIENGKKVAELINTSWHKYHTEESIRRTLAVMSPTSIEIKLTELINRNNLPFKFVGNGQLIIGSKIPDYVNTNGKKQLIELYGDYWHSLERTGRNKEDEERQRIDIFKQYGFSTLIIWEHELKDSQEVISKISQFTDGK